MFVVSMRRNTSGENTPRDNALFFALALSYLYNGINPFIYATKFDPVKRVLLGLIPCKKSSPDPDQNVGMS